MFCPRCGKENQSAAGFCAFCGSPMSGANPAYPPPPYSTAVKAKERGKYCALGFFLPLVGVILYLVWSSSKPRQANAAGKGALIGFITFVVVAILAIATIGIVMTTNAFHIRDRLEAMEKEKERAQVEKYVDVEFGEFEVGEETFFGYDTGVQIEVENITDERLTFYLTIEALDENGDVIDTDTCSFESVKSGKVVTDKIFSYVSEDLIEDMKDAEFRVSKISIREN